MALVLHNGTMQPLGQFDCLDAEVSSFKGGELCTFVATNLSAGDKAAADVLNDGYIPSGSAIRPAISKAAMAATVRPLFLADDGVLNYGTLFGEVVGGTTGQIITGGAVLGPATSVGSGKITLWAAAGIYGVTLDACDTAATGLVPTNTSLTVGSQLTWSSTGLLTPVGSAAASANSNTNVIATLVEFETNGSLVTTPANLVSALNSPSGSVSSLKPETLQ